MLCLSSEVQGERLVALHWARLQAKIAYNCKVFSLRVLAQLSYPRLASPEWALDNPGWFTDVITA